MVSGSYLSWPRLPELGSHPPSNGLMEKRHGGLIDIDRERLSERLRAFFDANLSQDAFSAIGGGLAKSSAAYEPQAARKKLQAAEGYDPEREMPYLILPFDTRWCYFSPVSPLWNRSRPALKEQCWEGNSFILSRVAGSKSVEGPPFFFTRGLSDDHLLAPDASCFPQRIREAVPEPTIGQSSLLGQDSGAPNERANVSIKARNYLAAVGLGDPDTDHEVGGAVWFHALASGFSPEYVDENADGIRRDWPRIPLPVTANGLLASAELGRRVAALLDVESPVDGVSSGQIRFELRPIGSIAKADGGQIDPAAGDLGVTAGWGHAGQGGICMPAKGRLIERAYTEAELAGFREGMAALGLTFDQLMTCLGGTCVDVYLNERAYWRCVPRRVWSYTIGGYQVMKKWLSYRERPLLGRDLTADDARYVTEMARRMTALLLLEPALDENYARVKAGTYAWPGGSS
jgi:hypothetical protein